MIDVNFEGLFTIELLHKFFADQLCNDFSITPSNQTLNAINGHKLVVKQYGNKLYAGAQSTGGTPFIAIETGLKMTFYMWLNSPLFFNYTNLPSTFDPATIYYFSNRNNTSANGKRYLSSKIKAYNNALSYRPGDLAVNSSGVASRAIRTNNPANKHGLTDANYWTAVDNNPYASASDILQWRASSSLYNFASPQSSANISVLGYNKVSHDYSTAVLTTAINFSSPVPSFTLDLSTLDPGKYSLTVNGARQWVYIDDELAAKKPFAVIDIYNETTPASTKLVNGTGKLLSPLYSIFFLNRATLWKYKLASLALSSISDDASIYQFAKLPDSITSVTPIPLTDSALDFTLTVNYNGTTPVQYKPIPCANPQRLTTLLQAGDTYPCSEIFLNY